MNSFEITFIDLKNLAKEVKKGNDDALIRYLNNFQGENILEKFKSILICWNDDVAQFLNLNLGEKSTKISLSYLISQFPESLGEEIKIIGEDLEITLDIPRLFDNLVLETLPIYSLVQYINISGISINLIDLSFIDRKNIIDKLPAKVYNTILNEIITNKSKTLLFDNKALSNFKFNLLTNEPFLFLKGLFTNFTDDYFKDVIFHLSKRIDGQILMNSTPSDIDYYIQKFSEEVKTQNNDLTL
jgi:hypothetical protein